MGKVAFTPQLLFKLHFHFSNFSSVKKLNLLYIEKHIRDGKKKDYWKFFRIHIIINNSYLLGPNLCFVLQFFLLKKRDQFSLGRGGHRAQTGKGTVFPPPSLPPLLFQAFTEELRGES